jgi:hypothetical protein
MTQYSGKVIRKTPVTPTQASASGVWKPNEVAVAVRNNTWPVAGVPDPISRSVRLRSSASANFTRTPASAGNLKTWTWSAWVKRGTLGVDQDLFSYYASGINETIRIGSNNSLYRYCVDTSGTVNRVLLNTTAVFRDPSAWYHIVVAEDTTQATDTNRVKIYVNGVQQAITATVWPALNWDSYLNRAVATNLLGYSGLYFDGCTAEVNFIDGQALTPSSFGTTDAQTGAWVPMAYTGTYGTNGFYLNFKDNTSTTTLGYDYSGNSNNWTANNISLTAGTTYDSMLDVPTPWIGYNTDGGVSVTRGNYATLNPLDYSASGTITLTNGNLTTSGSGAAQGFYKSTMSCDFKTYHEVFCTSVGSAGTWIGFATAPATTAGTGTIYYNAADGKIYLNGSITASYATFTTNDVIGLTYDPSTGSASFYKNNTLQGSVSTGFTNPVFAIVGDGSSLTVTLDANFGQRPFSYTPPTGFKALCTTNLPDSTIKKGNQYFDTALWTGDGTSSRDITSTIDTPDFLWIKKRSASDYHVLFDNVRGFADGKALYSNDTVAEGTYKYGYVSASAANKFTVAQGTSGAQYVNQSSQTYVGWQWKESVTAGFDIVTYTGTLTAAGTADIAHNLGVAPAMIITKARNGTSDWIVHHKSLSSWSHNLSLNGTAAQVDNSIYGTVTAPTSTTFRTNWVTGYNTNGSNLVAYLFAEVAGYSKFGSYTGNGSSDGPFVYTGFRPRWVMMKRTDSTSDWLIIDTSRDPYNVATQRLYPNLSDAEGVSGNILDSLSNGFKFRSANWNVSSGTYIFAAFAENPFKYSNAR